MRLLAVMRRFRESFRHQDPHPASHAEKLISTAGGFVGVLLVLLVSSQVLDFHGAALVVASMGASAVLLFATPHSSLSQPWPLLGGQLISAAIGVTCAQWMHNPFYAGALAVALSIGAMHYLRCLHPPGGATALVAVLGGEPVRALGYGFLVTPVLINVTIILIVAVAANYAFPWRRYPHWLSEPQGGQDEKCVIAHSDLVYALSEIDSFIDVSEEDLLRIYQMAVGHTQKPARVDIA
ncbi:MAG: HPP family protein [Betaproteobacteria bacterium]|nr:HPP family protein [Betaproteobacteria bacterium]